MNRNIRSLALVVSCFVLIAWPRVARSQNFYVNANAGPAFAEDVEVRRFVGLARGTEMKLDTGGRFTVAGGYNFNDFVGVQIETGVIHNEIERIGTARGVDGSVSHVPLLASAVLRYDQPECPVVAYVGAGLGGNASVLELDNVRAGAFIVDGSAGEVVFAWQVFAGARYRINDNMSIGAGYKFFSAEGASYDVRRTPVDITLGRACVHSAFADFTMTF